MKLLQIFCHLGQERETLNLKRLLIPVRLQLLRGRGANLKNSDFKTPARHIFAFTKWRDVNAVNSGRGGNQRYVFRTFSAVGTVKFSDHLAGRRKNPHHYVDAVLVHHKLQKLIFVQVDAEALALATFQRTFQRNAGLECGSLVLRLGRSIEQKTGKDEEEKRGN